MKIIIKRAVVYIFIVASISLFIMAVNGVEALILSSYPILPVWTMPVLASIAILIAGIFVWGKFEETEKLKQEFMTIVTHKLRTPLTHIKWAADELNKQVSDPKAQENINSIQEAAFKLVELTGMLVKLNSEEDSSSTKTHQNMMISKFIEEIVDSYNTQSEKRHITFNKNLDDKIVAKIDQERVKAVIQIILDNALNYTPEGGSISISMKTEKRKAIIDFKDSGIGISKSDLPHLFDKFHRSKAAQKADTGGLGIGLYLSREIIRRHGGTLKVSSEGENKGTTVTIILPLA